MAADGDGARSRCESDWLCAVRERAHVYRPDIRYRLWTASGCDAAAAICMRGSWPLFRPCADVESAESQPFGRFKLSLIDGRRGPSFARHSLEALPRASENGPSYEPERSRTRPQSILIWLAVGVTAMVLTRGVLSILIPVAFLVLLVSLTFVLGIFEKGYRTLQDWVYEITGRGAKETISVMTNAERGRSEAMARASEEQLKVIAERRRAG